MTDDCKECFLKQDDRNKRSSYNFLFCKKHQQGRKPNIFVRKQKAYPNQLTSNHFSFLYAGNILITQICFWRNLVSTISSSWHYSPGQHIHFGPYQRTSDLRVKNYLSDNLLHFLNLNP